MCFWIFLRFCVGCRCCASQNETSTNTIKIKRVVKDANGDALDFLYDLLKWICWSHDTTTFASEPGLLESTKCTDEFRFGGFNTRVKLLACMANGDGVSMICRERYMWQAQMMATELKYVDAWQRGTLNVGMPLKLLLHRTNSGSNIYLIHIYKFQF